MTSETSSKSNNFIKDYISKVRKENPSKQVVTRFPPEPNGYLHIGHAKSICLNFGLAEEFGGRCHLRFDDTNPVTEDPEYVESIKKDIQWLGFGWGEHLYHASDYFDQLHDYAVQLIKKGYAFVDDCSADEIKKMRGSLTEQGQNSPYRDRTPEENLELFQKMREGAFKDGEKVLRAKIDMTSPNMNLRDPLLYRIRHTSHDRTGDKWCIYPLYDFAHGLSDEIEAITFSICTLEFEDHRPLYDWFLEVLETPNRPQQIEFAKLNLDHIITSKRRLLRLVEEKYVTGWDDPRMPTISGLRRRGVTPASIRKFAETVGVTKKNSVISLSTLEHAVREDLDENAPRAMAVLDPIKIVIENYPEEKVEELTGQRHPKKEDWGSRKIPFTREIYIDREDFLEEAPKSFFRLKPDGKVRLRYGYVIHCHEVKKNTAGEVVELRCTYDERTKGGVTPEGEKKVKGIIHWVSATHGLPAEIRVYDRLFTVPNPSADKEKDFVEFINPESLIVKKGFVEASLKGIEAGKNFQFERLGFFFSDLKEHTPSNLIFNRTVTLKDTWAKVATKD
ncbi:MAG: glutamine--tRNA ligase/YqeY domain fusion protein [Bdellovibrionales bacterium]|nr:glutamine--tRNA ligase/YqeY domain fusion protein [Bdellovibrionales bacterium]